MHFLSYSNNGCFSNALQLPIMKVSSKYLCIGRRRWS